MNKINQKKTLSVYPEISEIGYASHIDSVKLNTMFNSMEESSLRALIRSREINTEIERLNLGTIKQYQAMESRTNAINYENNPPISRTSETSDTSISNQFAVASTFSVKNDKTSEGSILYDIAYGYCTLNPIGSYSKIPRGDGYDGRVSPQVTAYINGDQLGKDSVIYDALDGTNTSFWIKEVAKNSTHEIRVDMPPSITKRFNYIELYPFPIYGQKILKIEYVDFYGNRWDVTRDMYGMNQLQNNTGESVKLYTSPREFNGTIYITVKATELGVIGFSNIDVKFLDFNNTTQTGFLKFDTFNYYKSTLAREKRLLINSCLVDFYFDSPRASTLITSLDKSPIKAWLRTGKYNATTNSIDLSGISGDLVNEISLVLSDNITLVDINKNIKLSQDEDLWLVFELREHNVTTPVVRGAKVVFEQSS